MKRVSKLSVIRLMMIAAQLLLTGLVVHWLNMQYKENEQLLASEVDRAWVTAQQQMIDSVLWKDYIEPAMDSSTNMNFRFEFSDSTRPVEMIERRHPATIRQPIERTLDNRITINITDSSDRTGMKRDTFRIEHKGDIARDLVLQGVKLFVNKHSSSRGTDEFTARFMNHDTALLKKAFNDRLQAISPSLEMVWNDQDTARQVNTRKVRKVEIERSHIDVRTIRRDSLSEDPARYIADRHFNGNEVPSFKYDLMFNGSHIQVGVVGYKMLVIREILPQAAFALLLVLLTGAAFITGLRSLKTQVALNNQRDDFIRNMSHELKTPVATVRVALEALKNFNRRNDPQLMNDYLGMAFDETKRLEMLINRVMNVSTSSKETLPLNTEQVDLNGLIGEIIRSVKPRIEAEGAVLNYVPPGDIIIVNIDRLHMHGVLANLVDNSMKYSSPPAEVTIECFAERDKAIIRILDRGIGIPVEYRKHIFEKFFRVPTADLHNIKGYGLGLTYASMVMKQHGGALTYHERQGGGSVFEVVLKLENKA